MTSGSKRLVGAALVAAVALSVVVEAAFGSEAFTIANPNWFINLTGFGYADIAADVEGSRSDPQYFREYLSGEWGAAIGYQGAATVEWLERLFVFPDWQTNSSFTITSPFGYQDRNGDRNPDFNADGFNIYTSTIANARFSITQTYEFVNAGVGIAQGNHPRSAPDPKSNITGDQYVLKQVYIIQNRSSETLRGVRLYQFLHGLHSTRAVFDDNNYDEPSMCLGVRCSDYHFDTTMSGIARAFVDLDRPFKDTQGEPTRAIDMTDIFGFVPQLDDAFFKSLLGKNEAAIDAAFRAFNVIAPAELISGIARADEYVVNTDAIAFHSNDAPVAWEVGRYGVRGTDSHETGKPGTGVHLSVESGSLNGVDLFAPGDKWVSGAQAFALGDLNPGASVTFDVLLSVSTTQQVTRK